MPEDKVILNHIIKTDEVDYSIQEAAQALDGLRKFAEEPKGRFKSKEQAAAIVGALQGLDQLIILPTGGGKTMAYLVPMFMEKDLTTVVILPFVVLVEQVEQLCTSFGISVQTWRGSGYSIGATQAILVSIEHAIMPEFLDLLISLESNRRLARMVLDECHALWTQEGFRDSVRRLVLLTRAVKVPIQLLTATCPPSKVDKLRVNFGCEDLQVIRRIEDRKELMYSVQYVDKDVNTLEDLNLIIENYLRRQIQRWEAKDRGIVYCLRREWAEQLCESINRTGERICAVYHARMESADRRKVLADWKEGRTRIVIATSALGAGMDYPWVRVVVHQGFAQQLIDFVQESGRAGRDGQPAEAITFFWPRIEEMTAWIKEEGRKEMLEWVKLDGCRKKFLSTYLHGEGDDCISQGVGILCDNCEGVLATGRMESADFGPTVTGRKRPRDTEVTEVEDSIKMKEMLQDLSGKCSFCWMAGEQDHIEHNAWECRYKSL